ncbi:MAG: type IV-A pilus assembly ATPase PilB [Oligoflexales bacterium]|nr:type IV-A pilus assembly ATPase PilB [Oligoflexales bacterium]
MNSQDKKFYELLVNGLKISVQHIKEAEAIAREKNSTVLQVLISMKAHEENHLLAAYSNAYGIQISNLDQMDIPQNIIGLIPSDLAKKLKFIPIDKVGQNIIVAMGNPLDLKLIDLIRFKTGFQPKPVLSTDEKIFNALRRYYGASKLDLGDLDRDESIEEPQKNLENRASIGGDTSSSEEKEMAPVIKLVNEILINCLNLGASDIHIEPYETYLRIRFRVDGVLHEIARPPGKFKNPLISRIKIMSNLDIAEKRLPQDGGIRVNINNKPIDFRVNVCPTLYGEKVVLRILDKSSLQVDMTKLGLEKIDFERLQAAIHKPFGMVLVTGPTGSGKTTTLYSALAELNKTSENILTAEDPVEFNIEGINQVQVNPIINFNFSEALRAFLRQDPDIIMVGEIRDQETGEIAIKAALTGHLVLSTLHTNSAADTIIRLQNLGLESFNLMSSLNVIVAQRLVRRLCDKCKIPDDSIKPEHLIKIGIPSHLAPKVKPFRGNGCPSCNKSGYKGRVAVFEVLSVNDDIKEAILAERSSMELKRIAMENGMKTLRQNALAKLIAGETDAREVVKATATDNTTDGKNMAS